MTFNHQKFRQNLMIYIVIYYIIVAIILRYLLYSDIPDEFAHYLALPEDYKILLYIGIAAICLLVALSINMIAVMIIVKKFGRS